ncbi:acyl carrier protein [uncultured Algibacter sp.]|uniref:acyl carrier protein n=1 Tax=uncultured Algibacter sp. TaxID=298659 RepID=UPI002617539B|nr:acyl carrier protein [uncultured Algibacter sp.]
MLNNEIEDDFDDTEDLLGSGILDSLGMVQLIAFVEGEFNVQVGPEDMVIENFMTVNHIVNYIQSK